MVYRPRFSCSVTIDGECTIQTDLGPFTIPEGVYWMDPHKASDGVAPARGPDDILQAIEDAVDADLGISIDTIADPALYYHSFTNADYSAYLGDPLVVDTTWYARLRGDVFDILPTHANTTDLGRMVLSRLGFDVHTDGTSTSAIGLCRGIWWPNRPEAGSLDEDGDGFSVSCETFGDRVYTVNSGSRIGRRVVSFRGMPGVLARAGRQAGAMYDISFEAVMMPALMRGERIRYYQNPVSGYSYGATDIAWSDADGETNTTWLTAALSSTDYTATVDNATYFDDTNVWIDGEWVNAASTSDTTLQLIRPHPVAHAAGAPISAGFVATYVLGESGTVGRGGFAPKRSAVNQDRWDFDIELIRAGE